jgi:NADH:ubiquinone oxidoreductase subunit 3 (subunit A)
MSKLSSYILGQSISKELGIEGMVKMVIFMVLLLVGFSTSSKKALE